MGHVVQVPFKQSLVQAIVTEIFEDQPEKPLKNIEGLAWPTPLISQPQRELIAWLSTIYGVSPGTLAKMMVPQIPKRVMKRKKMLTISPFPYTLERIDVISTSDSTLSCDDNTMFTFTALWEKYALYRDLARTCMASSRQILFLCPTVRDVKDLLAFFQAQDIVAVATHSECSLTEHFAAYCALEKKEILIGISTRAGVLLNIPSLATIVIDQAERPDYKQSDQNPRYDARDVAYHLAASRSARVIEVTTAPRLEAWYTHPDHTTSLMQGEKSLAKIQCINLGDEFRSKNFSFISDDLKQALTDSVTRQETAFLFLNRRGVSTVVCKACDEMFSCPTCKWPMRYFASLSQLVCARCEVKMPLPDRCPQCGQTAYKSQGVGIEKIVLTLRQLFPHYTVESLDSKSTLEKNHSWKKKIIVGTSFAQIQHPELFNEASFVGIIIGDPIYGNNARAGELQWQTLANLLMLANSHNLPVIVQAFDPHHSFIQTLITGDYATFAEAQLKERKTFKLPPFTKEIKIWHKGIKTDATQSTFAAIEKWAKNLSNQLDKIEKNSTLCDIYKADFIIIIRINEPYTLLLTLPEPITAYLKTLPQGWLVDIDPIEI